ncbi:hypothetical protein QFC22_006154 [Naganishia vaughanmartiniae]|uniref:Uncharacterized protein n=1 Tax=Naganishia vaughanmartiniae TaxID=1424756 RepID=A0ACC2WNR4_9TREE|nr:hypothetical protein QFC22_006154 [Naganishia vaughanmartiniae]
MHAKFSVMGSLACLLTVFTSFDTIMALPTSTSNILNSRSSDLRSLSKRQSVVAGTVCATVPIVVNVALVPYTLINGICLCTEAGVLTPDSVATLDTQIVAGDSVVGGTIDTVATLVGGLANLLGLARTSGQNGVNDTPATCAYPANSSPVCPGTAGSSTLPGTTCAFTCDATYQQCGSSFCIASTQTCVSGIPARRALTPATLAGALVSGDALCPSGLTACYLADYASLSKGRPVSWDCIDPATNIESCGGCLWPVAGQGARGEDCTAAEGVDHVSCNQGTCEASSCMRGYKLNGTECALDAVKSFWRAI